MSEITEENTKITELDEIHKEKGWEDEEMPDYILRNVLVKHLDGPLFLALQPDLRKS